METIKYEIGKLPEDDSMNNIIDSLCKDMIKKQDNIFEKTLREFAIPSIKGEITRGKIKWRGIKIIQQNKGFKIIKYLIQRGKQIGPKIIIEGIPSKKFLEYWI